MHTNIEKEKLVFPCHPTYPIFHPTLDFPNSNLREMGSYFTFVKELLLLNVKCYLKSI